MNDWTDRLMDRGTYILFKVVIINVSDIFRFVLANLFPVNPYRASWRLQVIIMTWDVDVTKRTRIHSLRVTPDVPVTDLVGNRFSCVVLLRQATRTEIPGNVNSRGLQRPCL